MAPSCGPGVVHEIESHILFGTDYNRFPMSHSAKLLAGLTLPNDVRRGIERDNAIKLFPRLA